MIEPRNVVLVGHCGPDMFMLKNAVGRIVPEAKIEAISDENELETHLEESSVLLVNRVLDGRFADERGIELIRRISQRAAAPVALLVSNLADAQEEAIAAGARPGFGKSELYDERTAERLRAVVETSGP